MTDFIKELDDIKITIDKLEDYFNKTVFKEGTVNKEFISKKLQCLKSDYEKIRRKIE